MPQGANAGKSGGKKKGRAPAHQNSFAFKHNPKSKKTDKILSAPNVHVCRRCFDKIEWRKKYRKYKPRTQPGKCNLCERRNVMAAYHTICTTCTVSEKARKSMMEAQQQDDSNAQEKAEHEDDTTEMVESAAELKLENDGQYSQSMEDSSVSCHRVCAMCVKEPALPDEEEDPETVDDILVKENRRIKLRERRALERNLAREQEEVKQAAKEARRREREGEAYKGGSEGDDEKEKASVSSYHEENTDDDDEEDPFLQAVGGEEQLLTGEAYQRMLLEREKQGLPSGN